MISVIVPVYNVEKYLDQCIKSILNQTFRDFELILVDDGSTDNSGKMCDKYSLKDKRVRVIHKENGGLSDARNKGTRAAKGTHITYIDSDDFVSVDYLYTLWNLIKKYKADMAVTGMEVFFDGNSPKKTNNKNKIRNFSGNDALKTVLYQNGMDTSACAMLISSSIAKKFNFPFGKYHEDDFTTYKYYLNADRVAISSDKQYFYRQRKGSIMHSFGKANIDELDAADNLVNVLSVINTELGKAAKAKKFSNYCQTIINFDNLRKERPDVYFRITKYIMEVRFEILKDKSCRKKNRIASAICVGGVKPLIFTYKIVRALKKFMHR